MKRQHHCRFFRIFFLDIDDRMSRMTAQLTVKIVAKDEHHGTVALSDFVGFCRNLQKCLRNVEKSVGNQQGRMTYRVSEIKSGSIDITLEAEPVNQIDDEHDDERGEKIFDGFRETLSRLLRGKAPKEKLQQEQLETFANLAKPLKGSIKSIEIEDIAISEKLATTVAKLAAIRIPAEGSAKGRLEQLNLHNKTQFVIYPPTANFPIHCEFNESMMKTVYKAINKTVTVSGTLHFKPDKPFPDLVHVKSMEIHPDDSKLPKLKDLRGEWKGFKGKLTAVEFVRSIRDE